MLLIDCNTTDPPLYATLNYPSYTNKHQTEMPVITVKKEKNQNTTFPFFCT